MPSDGPRGRPFRPTAEQARPIAGRLTSSPNARDSRSTEPPQLRLAVSEASLLEASVPREAFRPDIARRRPPTVTWEPQ